MQQNTKRNQHNKIKSCIDQIKIKTPFESLLIKSKLRGQPFTI